MNQTTDNNIIDSDSQGRRSFVAPLLAAGSGERQKDYTMFRSAVIAAIFSAVLLGCGGQAGSERAIRSSDQEYMANLQALLDKRHIPYRYVDGYVRYTADVESQVEEAKKRLSSTKSVNFEDEEARTHFRALLDKENIEYLSLKKGGGSWTMWWPESDAQEQALLLKAVEYEFANKKHGP